MKLSHLLFLTLLLTLQTPKPASPLTLSPTDHTYLKSNYRTTIQESVLIRDDLLFFRPKTHLNHIFQKAMAPLALTIAGFSNEFLKDERKLYLSSSSSKNAIKHRENYQKAELARNIFAAVFSALIHVQF